MATSRTAGREAVCALTDEFPLVVSHFGVTPEVDLPLHDEAMIVAEESVDGSRAVRLLNPEQVATLEILQQRGRLPMALTLDTLTLPLVTPPKSRQATEGLLGLAATAHRLGNELTAAAEAAEAKYSLFLDTPTTALELHGAVQRSAIRTGAAVPAREARRNAEAAGQVAEATVAASGLIARWKQRRAASRQRRMEAREKDYLDFIAKAFA